MHIVSLDAFYIDKYEVTNARYTKCVSAGACRPPTNFGSYTHISYYDNAQFADYTVIQVNWEMAEAYCGWRGGRLPTEAQWEEAARGGLLAMDYPWGNDRPVCDKGAQNGANSYVCATKDTEAVGSYRPNGYGLFDMAGNVWEWVWDWYSSNYYSSQTSFVNPFGPVNGFLRVARGSSWNLVQAGMNDMSVANRGMQSPTYSSDDLGFRCVRAS